MRDKESLEPRTGSGAGDAGCGGARTAGRVDYRNIASIKHLEGGWGMGWDEIEAAHITVSLPLFLLLLGRGRCPPIGLHFLRR